MTWIINIIQIHHLNNIDATVVAQISLYFLFERVENWIKKKKKKDCTHIVCGRLVHQSYIYLIKIQYNLSNCEI